MTAAPGAMRLPVAARRVHSCRLRGGQAIGAPLARRERVGAAGPTLRSSWVARHPAHRRARRRPGGDPSHHFMESLTKNGPSAPAWRLLTRPVRPLTTLLSTAQSLDTNPADISKERETGHFYLALTFTSASNPFSPPPRRPRSGGHCR